MAELQYNQIRLYPFDAEELDEEELQLNERIRVSYLFTRMAIAHTTVFRKCCLSLSSDQSAASSSMASLCEGGKTAGE